MCLNAMERGEGCRVALLWDLDNVTTRQRGLTSLAQTLSSLVPSDAPRLAAAHRTLARQCQPLLAGCNIRLVSAGRRSNGADRLLLVRAQSLQSSGTTCLLVASNDGLFALLPANVEVHVLTLHPARVSNRLKERAQSVSTLSRDKTDWSVQPVSSVARLAPDLILTPKDSTADLSDSGRQGKFCI